MPAKKQHPWETDWYKEASKKVRHIRYLRSKHEQGKMYPKKQCLYCDTIYQPRFKVQFSCGAAECITKNKRNPSPKKNQPQIKYEIETKLSPVWETKWFKKLDYRVRHINYQQTKYKAGKAIHFPKKQCLYCNKIYQPRLEKQFTCGAVECKRLHDRTIRDKQSGTAKFKAYTAAYRARFFSKPENKERMKVYMKNYSYLKKQAKPSIPKKKCLYCDKIYQPCMKVQITCGAIECKRLRGLDYYKKKSHTSTFKAKMAAYKARLFSNPANRKRLKTYDKNYYYLKKQAKPTLPKRECLYCDKVYQPRIEKQFTCGAAECKRLHGVDYSKNYYINQTAKPTLPKRECLYCGKIYQPSLEKQFTCGAAECKRLRDVDYSKNYYIKKQDKLRTS